MTAHATAWLADTLAHLRLSGPAVRVTVVRADGSTPREVGAAMLVGADGLQGTIGGGALELAAIGHATGMLEAKGEIAPAWQREARDFALGPSLGQCCGGYTRLLFELFTVREMPVLMHFCEAAGMEDALLVRPLDSGVPLQTLLDRKGEIVGCPQRVLRVARDMLSGARPRQAELVAEDGSWFVEPCARSLTPLFVYGAGHVGRALVHVLQDLPLAVTWVDTQRARFPETLPAHVQAVMAPDVVAVAAAAPAGALHVVLTFSHALDLAICFALLRRADFGFLGLIGSATKRVRFQKRLREAGIADSTLARLICPIGIPGVNGKEPAVIAVSVAAQLAALVCGGQAVGLSSSERSP